MLSHDHEAGDALAALSTPLEHTSLGWTRRKFLMAAAAGGATAAAASMVPDAWREAWAAPPIAATDGILILIGLYGGNDGLNTVVPITNADYYARRGAVALQPASTLAITPDLGLNPGLAFLQNEYRSGRVAIVQGVGYPQYDRSHFSSMDLWMRGLADRASKSPTGWVGRYLDGIGASTELLQGVSFGNSVPLLVKGATRNFTAVPTDQGFFGSSKDADARAAYAALRSMKTTATATGPWGLEIADAQVDLLDLADSTTPFYTPALTGSGLARQLVLAARMINANIGLRVFNASHGGFDTHTNQQPGHQARLADLDGALRAFWSTISPAFANRVTIMTFSEFGREPRGNASNGTDHGAPSCLLLMGPRVAGGVHGALPNLASVDRSGQLAFTVDFRSVYATVLETWLHADADGILGGRFERLASFAGGPTDAPYVPGAPAPGAPGGGGGVGGVGVPGGPPSAPGSYVALTPFRIVDTRSGQGGEALGPKQSLNTKVTGVGAVPAGGVTAVMLNVTVDAPTSDGFITVWPGGEVRPVSSNLNFTARQTVPNLVLCKVGSDGTVSLFNHAGQTQLVVDVVGYFSTGPAGAGSTATNLVALPPARVIDTRTTGKPLTGGSVLELALAGVAGVPATGADAVVVNLTVTEPTAAAFLTVWPAGQAKPLASSLNFVAGQTVPNLVVAKLGDGGKVDLAVNTGAAHVIADVVGYFSTTPPTGKGIALSPRRLLDTRTTNASLSYAKTATVVVTGGDVPPTAAAVMLNVTVTEPTSAGFVTVWPSGGERPLASSLNFVRNQTVPNLVLAKVGAGGAVELYAHSPSAHLVVDLVGYFS